MTLPKPELRLRTIKTKPISLGGYLIGYDGDVPRNAKLYLYVLNEGAKFDVTSRPRHDLIDADLLPKFLETIARVEAWGKSGRCELWAIDAQGNTLTRSRAEFFDTPVQPYVGALNLYIGRETKAPKMIYSGVLDGRYLWLPEIDGRYYFAYASKFETDPKRRGLNCITYAGASFGVAAATGAFQGTGEKLATHLGATQIGLENAAGKTIADQLGGSHRGTYLMWNTHHCVIIQDGVVFEFSQSKNSYDETLLRDWLGPTAHWTVRKTRSMF